MTISMQPLCGYVYAQACQKHGFFCNYTLCSASMAGLNVFLRPEVMELLDAFASCFLVKMTIFSTSMEELAVGLRNPGSRYCRLVQSGLRLLHRCHATDKEMCTRALQSNTPLTYGCHAGLLESIIPIRAGDKRIGTLVVGQYRDRDGVPSDVMAAWTSQAKMSETLLTAWQELPRLDAERRASMLRLADMLVRHILTSDYMSVRQGMLIERIIRYIDEHIDTSIEISALAKAVSKSESTVSHTVKKELGVSFSRLVNLRKIEKFESILHRDPGMRIQDAAAQLGFFDPLYFSRLYKKLRLVPPSAYLALVKENLVRAIETI